MCICLKYSNFFHNDNELLINGLKKEKKIDVIIMSSSSSSSSKDDPSSSSSSKRLCIEDDNNNNVIVAADQFDSNTNNDNKPNSSNSSKHYLIKTNNNNNDEENFESKRKSVLSSSSSINKNDDQPSTSSSSSLSSISHSNRDCSKQSNQFRKSRTSSSSSSISTSLLNRLIPPNIAHGRCLYYPGAYSSHGQLSNQYQTRRQCSQIYCCRCHQFQAPIPSSSSSSQSHQSSSPMQQPNKEWTIRLRNQNSSGHHSTVGRSSRIPSDLTAIPSSSSSSAITTGTDLINPNSLVGQKSSYEPESLLEIAARFVAEYIPYEYIEQQYSCIPEPVQKRIIFWSFPRDERYIRLYSSISSIFKQDFNLANYTNGTTTAAAVGTSSSSNLSMNIPSSPSLLWDLVGNPITTATTTTTTTASHHDHEWESRSTFNKGLHLLCSGTVRQVMQIGKQFF